MLDLEVIVPPRDVGTDIYSLPEMKRHLRISPTNTKLDLVIVEAINDAADMLKGMLNRTIFPTTYKRYVSRFPDELNDAGRIRYNLKGAIQLPYPPLVEVTAITVEGDSPETVVEPGNYFTREYMAIPEVVPTAAAYWPDVGSGGNRAVSITYTAGYPEYPSALKRLLKILAAHNIENPEATINEPRQMMINRRVDFGVEHLVNLLRIPVSYDDWGC